MKCFWHILSMYSVHHIPISLVPNLFWLDSVTIRIFLHIFDTFYVHKDKMGSKESRWHVFLTNGNLSIAMCFDIRLQRTHNKRKAHVLQFPLCISTHGFGSTLTWEHWATGWKCRMHCCVIIACTFIQTWLSLQEFRVTCGEGIADTNGEITISVAVIERFLSFCC